VGPWESELREDTGSKKRVAKRKAKTDEGRLEQPFVIVEFA
jgi:hypothetical protein